MLNDSSVSIMKSEMAGVAEILAPDFDGRWPRLHIRLKAHMRPMERGKTFGTNFLIKKIIPEQPNVISTNVTTVTLHAIRTTIWTEMLIKWSKWASM